MNYIFVDDLLSDYNIDLEILRPDSNLYSISLLQHKGVFHYREGFFGNENDESAKFNNFFDAALVNNSSLVATPEYSCPWTSIRYILDNQDKHPSKGKLWVLGTESATPQEIIEFRDHYNEFENIHILYEDEIEGAPSGVLLDPCCYIFKATTDAGEERIIVLIQFKTQHMGVWTSSIEQENMIPGQNLYIIRNRPDSIQLITIICSDVMAFDGSSIYPDTPYFWNNLPFIVLSLQMNPKPDNQRFKDFRNNILGKLNKDLITLNWSSLGSASFDENFFNIYSKSNIAIVTDHIKNITSNEENRIKKNHKKGLYYLFMKPNRHCFYFSPEIEALHLRMRKPMAGDAPNEVVKRLGPEMDQIFSFDKESNSFEEHESMDDGFQKFIEDHQINTSSLHSDEFSILDKERLITISTGDLVIKSEQQKWYEINTIQSFLLNDMETVNRYTVVFDHKANSRKLNQLNKLEELNFIILRDPSLFPKIIGTFKNNCTEVMFLENKGYRYNYNLVNKNDEYATVTNLGSATDGEAQQMLSQLLDLFAKEDREHKRIVVWYKPNIHSHDYKATEVPDFTKPSQSNLKSITKE